MGAMKKLSAEERAAMNKEGGLESQIQIKKSALKDTKNALKAAETKLDSDETAAKAQHEAEQSELKDAAAKLQKEKAKAIALKASERGTSDEVADLKEQSKRLEKEEEEAESTRQLRSQMLRISMPKRQDLRIKLHVRRPSLKRTVPRKLTSSSWSRKKKVKRKRRR